MTLRVPNSNCSPNVPYNNHAIRLVAAVWRIAANACATITITSPVPTAIAGCATRRRNNRFDVGSSSCWSPSLKLTEGNNVSPSAAMPPLAPNSIIINTPTMVHTFAARGTLSVGGRTPRTHNPVKTIAANRRSVFTRCNDIEYARAIDALCATNSYKTIKPPINASIITNTNVATAPLRTI